MTEVELGNDKRVEIGKNTSKDTLHNICLKIMFMERK